MRIREIKRKKIELEIKKLELELLLLEEQEEVKPPYSELDLKDRYLLFVADYWERYGKVPGRNKGIKKLEIKKWKLERIIKQTSYMFNGDKFNRQPNKHFFEAIKQINKLSQTGGAK